jgi:glycerophosphoryl diester phosphodiesterase
LEIFAHRGSSATAPENTLLAFQQAIDCQADGVELDVHLSADGVPVVIHDADVSRTTNGRGSVQRLTVAQLHALDAGQGEYVPTLAEVVELLEGRLTLYLEIKAEGIVPHVLRVLSQYPQAAWFLASFSHDVLRDARRAAPTAPLWLISVRAEDDDFAVLEEVKGTGLSLLFSAISQDVIERCQRENLMLAAWSVNDRSEARRLLVLAVQALCTDDPARIIAALATLA